MGFSYTYDQLNRLVQKSYPDTSTVSYVYDDDSRLTQVTDPTGTYQFTFDNMGRLTGTSTQSAFLTSRRFTTAYSGVYPERSRRDAAALRSAPARIFSSAYQRSSRVNSLSLPLVQKTPVTSLRLSIWALNLGGQTQSNRARPPSRDEVSSPLLAPSGEIRSHGSLRGDGAIRIPTAT